MPCVEMGGFGLVECSRTYDQGNCQLAGEQNWWEGVSLYAASLGPKSGRIYRLEAHS